MKIGILQCDSTNMEFRLEHGNYPDMFTSIFKNIEKSFEFTNYDVQCSQYPKFPCECDAYIITGSRYSVYDKHDWISKLENYVIELHKIKFPLIGICFGHQMIAKALGGRTELANQGWGVGIHKYNLIASKSWSDPVLNDFSIVAVHQDQVTELPEGAELLAESDFCPYASFRIDNHILTFQGHPEFTPSYTKQLIDDRKNLISDEVIKASLSSLKNEIDNTQVFRWIVDFIHSHSKV